MTNVTRMIFGLTLLGSSIGPVQAATIFTNRSLFDASTIGATSKSLPAVSTFKDTAGKIHTFDGITFDTSTAGDRSILQDGLYQKSVYLATLGGSVTISSGLNAFGIYIGSADGAVSFGYNVNGTTGNITTLNSSANGGTFIGFSDASPISVTFNLSALRELDIVSYVTTTNAAVIPSGPSTGGPSPAAAVPEPTTWAMMLIGFSLVAGASRYRRKAVKASFA